jgi:hypothetical protein
MRLIPSFPLKAYDNGLTPIKANYFYRMPSLLSSASFPVLLMFNIVLWQDYR